MTTSMASMWALSACSRVRSRSVLGSVTAAINPSTLAPPARITPVSPSTCTYTLFAAGGCIPGRPLGASASAFLPRNTTTGGPSFGFSSTRMRSGLSGLRPYSLRSFGCSMKSSAD